MNCASVNQGFCRGVAAIEFITSDHHQIGRTIEIDISDPQPSAKIRAGPSDREIGGLLQGCGKNVDASTSRCTGARRAHDQLIASGSIDISHSDRAAEAFARTWRVLDFL